MVGGENVRFIAPLIGEELDMWLEGLADFDAKRYWHAHEDWEDLWNAHKRRAAPKEEILFIQGMIQTAALLLNHERKKTRGVSNLRIKVNNKLADWGCVWGLDIVHHLQMMNVYADDVDAWNLDAQAYVLQRCERELQA